MKKVTRIIGAICLMGLLTFVSTSCKKDQNTAGMEVVTTEVETFATDGERAYINPDNFRFYWHAEDYIRVFNLAEDADESVSSVFYKYSPDGPSETAKFRGPAVGAKKDVGYRVFYPLAMVKYNDNEQLFMEDLGNYNRMTFHVSDHQQFSSYTENDHITSMVDPDAMPMAADPTRLSGSVIYLKQMFGIAAFSFKAPTGQEIIVDSVLLIDKGMEICGDVTLRLDRVAVTDEAMGSEHNLLNVWQAFENNDGTYETMLAEELGWLAWAPANTGRSIMMNCCFAKEEGADPTGVMLANTGGNSYTDFNFILRPTALSEGFSLTLYIHDYGTLTFDTNDGQIFYGSDNTPDYTWGVKRAKIKNFRYPTAIEIPE